jgi:dUTP pyrophosphatase
MKVQLVGGKIPTRKNPTDAGLDLYSKRDIFLRKGEPVSIPTGVKIELPPNTFGLIKPKSRHSFTIGAGVIDEGYRGEIIVMIIPNGNSYIKKGDPIAQLVVIPILYPKIQVVDDLSKTSRGETGGILGNATPDEPQTEIEAETNTEQQAEEIDLHTTPTRRPAAKKTTAKK